MCHPSDQKYMLVDKTWGIMPPSSMCLFVLGFYFLLFILFDILIVSFFQLGIVQKSPLKSGVSWKRSS